MWAQIELSFAKGIKPLKTHWIGFTFLLKEWWINTTTSVKNIWETSTTWIAKRMIDLQEKLDLDEKSTAQHEREKAELDKILTENTRTNNRERQQEIEKAALESAKSIDEINKRIKDLEAQRNKFVKQAADEAAKFNNIKPPKDPVSDVTTGYNRATEAIHKFDAALVGSAEAVARIREYQDRLSSKEPGKPTGTVTVSQAGSADAVAAQRRGNEILMEIRDAVRNKKSVDVKAAGFDPYAG
jgi:chromosome segregation ATPase